MISTLTKRIEEDEPKILVAFQALVREAHSNYKETLDKLMVSTNGQILHRLQVFPSIVIYSSQMIADHDVNDHVLASPSATRGLLMTSLHSVTMGLEDLYDQGVMMLSGAELRELRSLKLRTAAAEECRLQEYQDMVKKLSCAQAQLALLQKKPKHANFYQMHMLTNVAELHQDFEQAVAVLGRHLLYLLRNQFNYMLFEFKLVLTFDTALMRPMRYNNHTNSALFSLHSTLEALPDDVEAPRRAQLIKELTAGVNQLRRQYEKACIIALESLEGDLAALRPEDQMFPADKQFLHSFAGGLKVAKFTHKIFDFRVAWAHDEIKRYRNLIEQIGKSSWNEAMRKLSVEDAETRKEKLIQDLMGLERGRCEETGCICIEDEKIENAAVADSGTEKRNRDDRMKVEELLAGREPWKEKMDEFAEM
ncbi:hypothetical protein N431DRAFT_361205, partial [Stipitochalara longipes BDJ]